MEIIVLAVEVGAIGEDHPGKSQGLVTDLKQVGNAAEQVLFHAGIFQEIAAINRRAEIHSSQKITIVFGNRPELRIELQVLQIGLHNGIPRLQHFDQAVFALHEAIDHLVHGDRGCLSGRRGLRRLRRCALSRLRLHSCWRIRWLLCSRAQRQQQKTGEHPIPSSHNSFLHLFFSTPIGKPRVRLPSNRPPGRYARPA